MFQFTYKPRVTERVKAKSERHPRYNPERDGRGGIKGGCSTCYSLFDLHQARLSLDAAHREFLRRVVPWTQVRQRRTKPQSIKHDEPPLGSGQFEIKPGLLRRRIVSTTIPTNAYVPAFIRRME